MNTEIAYPAHQLSPRPVVVALAGFVIGAVAGLGVAAVVMDQAPDTTQAPGLRPAPTGVSGSDDAGREGYGLTRRR